MWAVKMFFHILLINGDKRAGCDSAQRSALPFHVETQPASLPSYREDRSLDDYIKTPLEEPLGIWPCIDTNLPTVIYTFGYRGKPTGPATTGVMTAYVTKKKRNLILLDWEEEAQSEPFGIPLGYAFRAVLNAKSVGMALGKALLQFNKAGLNMTHIHLVGHSLGAHLLGYAGRYTRQNGYVITRITGLDPARLLYEGFLGVYSGLDRTCAKFVDIVHSDPGGYGVCNSIGTVDIWPNLSGQGGNQPGCPVGDFQVFTTEDLCKHDRSWRYFADAITSPTAILAVSAASYEDWVTTGGQVNRTIYLADLTSIRATGNYYFTTNSQSPFGLGSEGLKPPTNRPNTRKCSLLKTFGRIIKFLS